MTDEDGAIKLQKMVTKAKEMRDQGYSNLEIANAMGITENYVRNLFPPEIKWGHNCLTVGVHHGRPEVLWNLPLFQAVVMFGTEELQQLVTARIHQDAMQFVEHGEGFRMPPEWADRTAALAEEQFAEKLMLKMSELQEYYDTPRWRSDVKEVIERFKKGKLNPHYKPLHGHDSLNLLCRILGTLSSIEASAEFRQKEKS